jgi:hypothetical protein
MSKTRWLVVPVLLAGLALLTPCAAHAQKPDFSGVWVRDVEKSDNMEEKVRDGAGSTREITKLNVQQVLTRLTHLARAAQEIEIEQSETDFKMFDREDNVVIYYIDGKKHLRETPWGEKLNTLTNWSGDDLLISTESKDLGKIRQVFTFDGETLVYVLQLELKGFEKTVIVRQLYNRKEGQ